MDLDLQQLKSHLWNCAEILRGSAVDRTDWKAYILPLLFFKRISDVWDEETAEATELFGDINPVDFPEVHRFTVPEGCHWRDVRETPANLGAALSRAIREIERANPDTLYRVFGAADWGNRDMLSDESLKDLIEGLSGVTLGNQDVASDILGDADRPGASNSVELNEDRMNPGAERAGWREIATSSVGADRAVAAARIMRGPEGMKSFYRQFLLACVLVILLSAGCATPVAPDDPLERARAVLYETPLIDTHNDLPWVIREKLGRDVEGYDIAQRARFDTDIPRLREGMVGAQFWSVYVPTSLEPLDAIRAQLEQIDIARRIIAKYPRDFGFAESVADIERERMRGRIASLLGIEGGHTIVDSLGALRAYYDLGVRYMTLTHFHSNNWADSATGEELHGGLSRFGEDVVREMNRLGMMVDISHVSAASMEDVLRVTEAPVLFSHSSAKAVTNHARNVPDEILKRMPDNGGVVMVAFVPPFVSEAARAWGDGLLPRLAEATSDAEWQQIEHDYIEEHGPSPRATLSDVADHVEHIARVAGHDHVGIGADFYGAELGWEIVEGLEDVSRYPYLFAELIRRGWSDENLRKLAAENVLRVFAEVEVVSQHLRLSRPPSLATIEESDGTQESPPQF